MIIGLLGRSRVGKDTAASFIINTLGSEQACITRLSQPLKDAAKCLYGFTQEQVEDHKKEEIDQRLGVTPRVCIQKLCEHIMSLHGNDFFSKQLYSRYDTSGFGFKHIVIPDIRYEHDIHEIRIRGGIIIKIVRTSDVPQHAWEDHVDSIHGDFLVANDSDITTLHTKISQILHNNGLS
jgi:hypothetical protein